MGESIQEFRNLTQRLDRGDQLEAVSGLDDKKQLRIMEPVKRPSGWTRFKAALGKVPLLRRAGSLQRARADVTKYRTYKDHEVSSRQLLAGFVQSLREEYGAEFANVALKEVNVKRGQLFTGHLAKTVFENVDKLEKARQSTNNANVLRFMEAPLREDSGASGPKGLKSMNDVFRERDLLTSEGSWKDAVGEDAAAMIQKYVEAEVKGHNLYSRDVVPNEFLQEAANKAIDLYLKFAGETEDFERTGVDLGEAFRSAAKGSSEWDMIHSARQTVLDQLVSKAVDPHRYDSVLDNVLEEVSEKAGRDPGRLPQRVKNSIADGTLGYLRAGWEELPAALGTRENLPSIWAKLPLELTEKLKQQLAGHYEALDLIEKSDDISPAHKDLLLKLAAARRIDATQVTAYEDGAKTIGRHLPELTKSVKALDFSGVINALRPLREQFDDSFDAMRIEAKEKWDGYFEGSDTNKKVLREMVNLALADMPGEDAKKLFETLTSQAAQQVFQGMVTAVDFDRIGGSGAPAMFKMLAEVLGAQAGLSPEEIESATNKLGELTQVPAHFVMQTVGATDARGATSAIRARDGVRPEFRPQKVMQGIEKQVIEDRMRGEIDEDTGLSKEFLTGLGHAAFVLNNRPLAGVGDVNEDEVVDTFKEAFRTEDGIDEAAAQAVSLLLNRGSIDPYTEAAEKAAFLRPVTTADKRSSFEAWKADNGDWFVRATQASKVTDVVIRDGQLIKLKDPGITAHSVTYRIPAESIAAGKPTVEIADAKSAFDF